MRLPTPGDSLDEYRIEAVLGEGGFGAVYLARDPMSHPVALKVLKPTSGEYDRQTRARFEREARVLAGLRSPHTVAMYKHGEARTGLLFTVFELLDGRDLSEHLAAVGPLPPQQVTHILIQVLQALDEAHRAGLIHRDIKPENVRVLGDSGGAMHVKLIDFGIARATDDGHPSITKTGELVGTPRYMSPEQLKGLPLTQTSDLYSLGMVAIELLVGPDALVGDSISDQLGRLVSSDALTNDDLAERAGPLLPILEKMTALDPRDRFPSAATVISALERLNERSGVRGAPSAAPVAATGLEPRRILLALGLMIAFTGAVAALLLLKKSEPEPSAKPAARRTVNAPFVRGSVPVVTPVATVAAPDVGQMRADAPVAPHPEPPADAVPSTGCGARAQDGLQVIDDQLAYVPKNYDPAYPHPTIVVARMDRQRPPALFEAAAFDELADRERAVILIPEDESLTDLYKVWRDEGDQGQLARLYDETARRLCLDRARTYVVGIGEGARMAFRATCADENWVTAIAIHSYLPRSKYELEDLGGRCRLRQVPMIWITPMDSDDVPIHGGQGCDLLSKREFLSLDALERMWTDGFGCRKTPQSLAPDVTMCEEWTCAHPFVSCRVPGGAGWSGSNMRGYPCLTEAPAGDTPAEEWVWGFFQQAPPLSPSFLALE